jgi:hypothetical protein
MPPTEDKMIDSLYEELEHIFRKFPKYLIQILLRDFSAIIGREDTFKPTIRNESLNEINDDNGVVNFPT